MQTHNISLGLCCVNTLLQKDGVICSRRPIIRTVEEKGISYLIEVARLNCMDLIKHLEWNSENGIRVFRISSDLLPHFANPMVEPYSINSVADLLKQAGDYAKRTGQRLTFHPGQYDVIATPNLDTFQKTLLDLHMHSTILDTMECGPDSVMVVHGGGIYGDKKATKKMWVERYNTLPQNIKRRLVLENCEKCFSIDDCLDISRECGVPVVLDLHHYECYNLLHRDEPHRGDVSDYYEDVLETWKRKSIKPKFHISSQGVGKIGKHADYITEIPQSFLDIPERFGISIDLMVEAKMKEQAIIQLREKYPFLN